jgi:excisionase family DNA binding protein
MSTTTSSHGLISYRVTYKDAGPGTQESLLTVKEVAGRLAIGRTTVYDLIARGEIPAIRIGRARRIPSSALDRFIADRME